MSPSDRLSETQEKMQEYIEQGVKLGWLINRKNRQVEIYRPGQDVEVLDSPTTLSGEDVLPNFVLERADCLGLTARILPIPNPVLII
jgi:Uma2 family endonuclease